MAFEKAERLKVLPPYLFAEIDRKKKAAMAAGRPILNLGIGDPDKPTPQFIIDALAQAVADPSTHSYALDEGDPGLRRAIATWFKGRFGVDLKADTEILPTIGSKEAIAHLPLAVVNPGDVVLVPDPGYPVYHAAGIFAGAEPQVMPLLAENDFLPDLDRIPAEVRKRARLMFLNYPNNPTSACATSDFFARAVEFARDNDLVIAQDAAYTELYYEEPPLSILETPGAAEVAVELHSFSKTFNMTGWRLGWACGNAEIVAALQKIKSNLDSGIFTAIQKAGAAALEGYDRPEIAGLRDMYRRRRDALVAGLRTVGLEPNLPGATFYVWVKCPAGRTSMEMAATLLDKCDIVVTPGVGFGACGDGYIRFALTVETARIAEAVERIGRLGL
ncbi:MAG: aminotransferase class I/II-fold pyridoxal phosphate-dependent enzyme [Anaerolineaceae bacterium]|nr:aminotransferase class I/II-fold pyridoxal phosphate-dependent enzyme [Anaerolineaceae bacterium]